MDIFTFPKERIIVDGRSFKVLVASTVKQREQGLSNVKLQTLKANGIDGMLFVFNEGNERTFQAWYMNFDLLLLGLEKTGPNQFKIVSRKLLNIGTTANIGGRYVLELPLTNNTLLGR
ncbi:MAG: hypothetical protein OHK0040_14340 [bacterium]